MYFGVECDDIYQKVMKDHNYIFSLCSISLIHYQNVMYSAESHICVCNKEQVYIG